ncbi:TraB/GumN family protein [Shimia sp. R10_1]|uniref:TraB/GumN family protein n=1 Tax=Shimia sp. R10_1 TaxID=2821095 RepID=UPI001ADA24CA|nr:TraB/GumN family protein [Shimia sp. R10_1]MBO9474449.1 TraB/GumN family protein [Shimia sp. R10_1]
MRVLYTLLFMLGFSGAAMANCEGPNLFDQRPEAERTAMQNAAAEAPFSEGLLWRVEKDGVVSHIIGTFHLHLPQHAATVTRLRSLTPPPQQLFMEMTSEDQLGFQRHLTQHPELFLIETGPSLIDRLGPEHWAVVSDQLKARGMPPFMAARYQPWFLGLTLMVPPCAFDIVKSGKKGLDLQIEALAQERDLPRVSLDTTERLISLLASDPIEAQVDDLRWSLTLGTDLSAPEMIPTVIDMYLSETIQLIWELNRADMRAAAKGDTDAERIADLLQQVEKDLIVARNTDWVKVLAPALSETPSLIAFGALHLPGKDGVLSQLNAAGFTITRLDL